MFTIDSENRLFTNRYPAVTYILNETKSKTAKLLLEQWKRNLIAKLGIEGFETYQKSTYTITLFTFINLNFYIYKFCYPLQIYY